MEWIAIAFMTVPVFAPVVVGMAPELGLEPEWAAVWFGVLFVMNIQIYFLNSRFGQLMDIQKSGKNVIQDRSIYEDAYIFAPNLHSMGLLTQRDFKNYISLFELMENMVSGPDLLIYLRSSIPNLVNQIHKRGRKYESTISIDYLSRLNERYEAWIQNYDKGKLLIIDGKTSGLKRKKDCNDDIPHYVPITPHMEKIFVRAKRFNQGEKYIFTPIRESRFPHLDPSAPNNFLRTLGFEGKLVSHGWRSVALTNGIDLSDLILKFLFFDIRTLINGSLEADTE